MLCFNPRAHVGRDISFHLVNLSLHVSIHAPTWGATACTWGGLLDFCFNPRAHVGRDVDEFWQRYIVGDVSIHAPTWGATSTVVHLAKHLWVSIHAPTWGAT